jgi:phosphoglycolate phosphatase
MRGGAPQVQAQRAARQRGGDTVRPVQQSVRSAAEHEGAADAADRWARPLAERLVLWDIDGTLLRAGDIAAEVFDSALAGVLGSVPAGRVMMSGKTDPQIVLEYLALGAVAEPERHVTAILARVESELRAARHLILERGRVLPGVLHLLPRLHDDPGFVQSVLTGNVAANALLKLEVFGLDRWLDLEIGAYGSDHRDRCELVPIALERVRRLRRLRFPGSAVWVVGDSANDLACARAGGARCLLVATGRTKRGELEGLGADIVLDDLSDVDGVLRLLSAESGAPSGPSRPRAGHRSGKASTDHRERGRIRDRT